MAGVAGNPAASAFLRLYQCGVADATRTAAAVNRRRGKGGKMEW